MEKRFLVDFMLGRLARWLRVLGFDTAYYRDDERDGIVYRSLKEKRIILTRDTSISPRKALGLYRVESEEFRRQLKEVVDRFSLEVDYEKLFSRCSECNLKTEPVEKNKVKGQVPEYVFRVHNNFSRCSGCGKIYWRGTHSKLVQRVLNQAGIKLKGSQR